MASAVHQLIIELKSVGEAQECGIYFINAYRFDSIQTEPDILFAKNTIKGYPELHADLYGIAVNNVTLELDMYGSVHNEELKTPRKSLFPETLPRAKYKLPKRGTFSKYDNNTKRGAPYLANDKLQHFNVWKTESDGDQQFLLDTIKTTG